MACRLIICRNHAGLRLAGRLSAQPFAGRTIIVSDNPAVQLAAGKLPGCSEVRYIERMESFYAVAADVRQLIETIDESLARLNDRHFGLPDAVFTWGLNIEGGITGQRVQDTLLLIRSGQALLTETAAQQIHLIATPDHLYEDRVFAACVQHQKLALQIHSTSRLALWRARLCEFLRPWAVAAYYLANLVRLGGGYSGRRAKPRVLSGEFVFQLASSTRKHVDNILPLMRSLAARGENPLALCWAASERCTRQTGATQLSMQGLVAIRLEPFVTLPDLIASCRIAWSAARQASRAGDGLVPRLSFEGVLLDGLLRPSLHHFFIAEVPQRIRFYHAMLACLGDAAPRAMKLSGGPESCDGKLFLAALRQNRAKPLLVHYWLGAALPWPYAEGRSDIDLFLAKGPAEVRLAQNDYGLREDQTAIIGQVRLDGYEEFAAETPPTVSRAILRLPDGFRRYIGFDPNAVLRGYQSAIEQAQMTSSLLGVVAQHKDVFLVIKPHPSYPIHHLKPLIQQAGLPNVIVLERQSSADHFVNAIDLLVTKYSSLILEAALLDRPSIAVILDGEDRFKVFGDMPETVKSAEAFEALVSRLAQSDSEYQVWREDQRLRQRQLLPAYYHRSMQQPAEMAAAAIVRCLPSKPT